MVGEFHKDLEPVGSLCSPPSGIWSAYSRAGSDLGARPIGFKPALWLPETEFPLLSSGALSIEQVALEYELCAHAVHVQKR